LEGKWKGRRIDFGFLMGREREAMEVRVSSLWQAWVWGWCGSPFRGRVGGRGHEAAEGIEDHTELTVVFLLHFIEFAETRHHSL
jgi:hypothetical protein